MFTLRFQYASGIKPSLQVKQLYLRCSDTFWIVAVKVKTGMAFEDDYKKNSPRP